MLELLKKYPMLIVNLEKPGLVLISAIHLMADVMTNPDKPDIEPENYDKLHFS